MTWVHRFPDRIPDFLGLHVSQPILPLHYDSERAWRILLNKMNEQPQRIVYNEVLGEDCDVGAKILPLSVLIDASCLPFENGERTTPLEWIGKGTYMLVSLGVDWGGRGEDGDSFTAIVVTGLRRDGRVDVLYAERLPPSDDDLAEISRISQIYREYRCNVIGHDFRGVGQSKDSRLVQSGFRHACPWSNEPGTCKFFAKTSKNQTGRIFVQVNRAAAIMLIAHEVTHGRMFLPKWPEDTPRNATMFFWLWAGVGPRHATPRRRRRRGGGVAQDMFGPRPQDVMVSQSTGFPRPSFLPAPGCIGTSARGCLPPRQSRGSPVLGAEAPRSAAQLERQHVTC